MKKRVPFFYGYVMLGAVWLLYFSIVGVILYGASVINARMQVDLGLRESDIGLVGTVCTLTSGLLGPIVGKMIARRGVRRPYLIGSGLVAAAGFLLAVCTRGLPGFLLFYGLAMGAGMGFAGIMTAQSAVNAWFDRRKPMAMAVALSAGSAGGFLAPQILQRLTDAAGWTAGWAFVGGMALLAFAVSGLVVVNRPEDIGQAPDGVSIPPREGTAAQPAALEPFRTVLRGPDFYLLLLNYGARTALYYSFVAYVVIFLRGEGYAAAYGAWVLSLISLLSLAGRLAMGALPERWVPANVSLGVGNVMMGLGTLVVTVAHAPPAIALGASGFGLGLGVVTVALPLTVARRYGTGRFPVVNGNLSLLNYLVGAGGPAAVGVAAGLMGGYRLPFAAVAVLTILGGVGVLFLRLRTKEVGGGELSAKSTGT